VIGSAGLAVAVVDHGMPIDQRPVAGLEKLSTGAEIGVAGRVVAKLLLAEQPVADR
jgi:hypothetical protein